MALKPCEGLTICLQKSYNVKLFNLVSYFESSLQKPETKDEIMFQYCFPRLDVNVTKGLNHLLKSPFCVHPKTGEFTQEQPLDPLILKSAKNQNSEKIPNFILKNNVKQMVPCKGTASKVSFEWLHHKILSTDSKVGTTLHVSIIDSGSERVKY